MKVPRTALIGIPMLIVFAAAVFPARIALRTHAALPIRHSGAGANSVVIGRYLETLADCEPCHTSPDGAPFSGGRAFETPFGRLISPNITADPETGIGRWDSQSFYNAVHNGIGVHGQYLYPVMPFGSYAAMPRRDVDAIRDYLMSLPIVRVHRPTARMRFPYNYRLLLIFWRWFNFKPGNAVYAPPGSARRARGIYIVWGPGHCAECHGRRNWMGGLQSRNRLEGGSVDGLVAPNLSSNVDVGIGTWSIEELEHYLASGNTARDHAFGPMALVIGHSTSRLTAADRRAVAIALHDSPPDQSPRVADQSDSADAASVARGAKIYDENCIACHRGSGAGLKNAIPRLAGRRVFAGPGAANIIIPTLLGLDGGPAQGGAMPGFASHLSDQEIADLVNSIRNRWNSTSDKNVRAEDVKILRNHIAFASDQPR